MRAHRAIQVVWALALSGFFGTPLAAQTSSTPDPAPTSFEIAARSRGTPDIPGLNMVWLTPWSDLRYARNWRNIIVHQAEGPAGSAWRSAVAQMEKPRRKGVTIWVETDGTVYWATAEFAAPSHIRSGNRGDNKYIDNAPTFLQLDSADSIGVEFVGNYPNVRKPVTEAQIAAWKILVRVLQTRYGIPDDHVFAHNWIDYKDQRYCEGCELAQMARTQAMQATTQLMVPVMPPALPPANLPAAGDSNAEQKSDEQ